LIILRNSITTEHKHGNKVVGSVGLAATWGCK